MAFKYSMDILSIILVIFVGFILLKASFRLLSLKKDSNTSIVYLSSKGQFNTFFSVGIILYLLALIIVILGLIPSTGVSIAKYNVYLVGLIPWIISVPKIAMLNDSKVFINIFKPINIEDISYIKLEKDNTGKQKIHLLLKKGFDFYINGSNQENLLEVHKSLEARCKSKEVK